MKEMKKFRAWLAVFALAIPSIAIAQGFPGERPVEIDPPGLLDPEENPATTYPAPNDVSDAANSADAERKKAAADAMMRRQTAVMKGAVLPMLAGLGSGEMGAAALHQLAATEYFERRDARATIGLAKIAVAIAHERADRLHEIPGLSEGAQAAARSAKESLKEARYAVERIEREVGVIAGLLKIDETMMVRKQALKLHVALANAKMAIEKVASEYGIPTTLNYAAGRVLSSSD